MCSSDLNPAFARGLFGKFNGFVERAIEQLGVFRLEKRLSSTACEIAKEQSVRNAPGGRISVGAYFPGASVEVTGLGPGCIDVLHR